MKDFFKKYNVILFGFFPMWVVLGNISQLLSFVAFIISLFYFATVRKTEYIVISFLIILILADSVIPMFWFMANLKVVAMVSMTVVSIWDIRRGLYHVNKSFFAFLPFVLVAIVALNASPMQGNAALKTFSFTALWFSGFHIIRYLFYNYGGSFLRDVTHLATLILVAGLVLTVIAPQYVYYISTWRYSGIFRNPNGMGLFVTLVLPLYVFYFTEQGNVSLATKVFAISILSFSLIMCASRNAILSNLIFLNLFYAMKGNLFRRLFFMIGVIPLMVIVVSNFSVDDVIGIFGAESYLRVSDIHTGSGRTVAWAHGLNLAADQMLVGCGFGCEEYYFIYQPPYELWLSGHQGGIHNSYLSLLINVGVLGLLALGFFFFSMIRKISNYQFLLPYLASVLFSAIFESWMAASLNAFTVFFVIMLMVLTVGEKTKLFPIE